MSGNEPRDSESIVLEIDALAAGGRGVARHEGRVWFVARAVPGDRVRPIVLRERDRFVEARVGEWVERSRDRRESPCPIQDTCGGCPWMVLPEAVQRDWRRRLVVDAIQRIGGLEDPIVEEISAAPESLAYRNRAEPAWGLDAQGRPVLGFRGDDGQLVDVSTCAVLPASANTVLLELRRQLVERIEPEVLSVLQKSPAFRIGIRTSAATGEVMVALYESSVPFPNAARLARTLCRSRGRVRGVVRVRIQPGRRGGATVDILDGEGSIAEEVGGLRFQLPAATFLQVNSAVGEFLIDRVREMAGDVSGKVVLDLYGGVGALGLTLAKQGAHVFVVEADRAAVKCGRRAARTAELVHVRYRHGEVLRFLQARAAASGLAEVVVADPPRTGLGRGVAQAIVNLAPARIILISCDPANAGRDIKALHRLGYKLKRVVPLDMFPQTAHVETVSLLERHLE